MEKRNWDFEEGFEVRDFEEGFESHPQYQN